MQAGEGGGGSSPSAPGPFPFCLRLPAAVYLSIQWARGWVSFSGTCKAIQP